jgi:hypothetical protein
MNKLLSTLLAGVFAATLGASAFAAEPASTTDAVKAPTANAAPMKQKHTHKAHKSHKAEKAEHAPAALEAAK